MFQNAKVQQYFLGIGVAVALINALAAPASAQSVIIINSGTPYYRGNQNSTVGNFIYGSPIATPIPVNPATGHMPTQSYFSKPYIQRKVDNSILVNPVLVNPVKIKSPRNQRRYRNSRRRRYR